MAITLREKKRDKGTHQEDRGDDDDNSGSWWQHHGSRFTASSHWTFNNFLCLQEGGVSQKKGVSLGYNGDSECVRPLPLGCLSIQSVRWYKYLTSVSNIPMNESLVIFPAWALNCYTYLCAVGYVIQLSRRVFFHFFRTYSWTPAYASGLTTFKTKKKTVRIFKKMIKEKFEVKC